MLNFTRSAGPTLGDVVYTPRGFRGTEAATLRLARFRDDESSLASWVVEHEADLYFTKTRDWQTEHEYRVTLFPGTTSDDGYVYVRSEAPSRFAR